jgi:hypothetical protein
MNVSRRELVTLAAAGIAAQGQPAKAQDAATADPAKAARDTIRSNSEALAKIEIPMATAPAFVFKP